MTTKEAEAEAAQLLLEERRLARFGLALGPVQAQRLKSLLLLLGWWGGSGTMTTRMKRVLSPRRYAAPDPAFVAQVRAESNNQAGSQGTFTSEVFADHLADLGIPGAEIVRAHGARGLGADRPRVRPSTAHIGVEPVGRSMGANRARRAELGGDAIFLAPHPFTHTGDISLTPTDENGDVYPVVQVGRHILDNRLVIGINHVPRGETNIANGVTHWVYPTSWDDFMHLTRDFPSWARKEIAARILRAGVMPPPTDPKTGKRRVLKFTRGTLPRKYAKVDGHVQAHPLVAGFPVEEALRHLANDPKNTEAIRAISKTALTGKDINGDPADVSASLWSLHDALHEAGHHMAEGHYNWMSAADKVNTDAITHEAFRREAERWRQEDDNPVITGGRAAWLYSPEWAAHHINRARRAETSPDYGYGPDSPEAQALKRVREYVKKNKKDIPPEQIEESIKRHAYRARLRYLRTHVGVEGYHRDHTLRPLDEPRSRSSAERFGDNRNHAYDEEKAARYKRKPKRYARIPGEAIHPDVMALAVESLTHPHNEEIVRAFIDRLQEEHPEAGIGESLSNWINSEASRTYDPDRRISSDLNWLNRTRHYPTTQTNDRIEIHPTWQLPGDGSWEELHATVPRYIRDDETGQWERVINRPEGERRGRLVRRKRISPEQLAREVASHGLDNLAHAVVGSHYFSPGGGGRPGGKKYSRPRRYLKPRNDFIDALRRIRSSNQQALHKTATQLADKLGLQPTKILNALHDTPHGSTPGIAQAIYGPAVPEAVHQAAAWIGLTANSPGVAVFHFREQGPDSIHRVRHVGSGMELRARLDRFGLRERVLIPHKKGFDVLIPDKGSRMAPAVEQFAEATKSVPETSRGFIAAVGSPDRSAARDKYRGEVVKGEHSLAMARKNRPVRYSHQAFQDQIGDNERDSNARAVYADWIEENEPHSATPDTLHRLRTYQGRMWVGLSPGGKVLAIPTVTKEWLAANPSSLLWHRTSRNRKGQAHSVRQSGRLKTWKTRPDDFRVPWKFGLYENGEVTHNNAHEWLTEDPTSEPTDLPVRHSRVTRLAASAKAKLRVLSDACV